MRKLTAFQSNEPCCLCRAGALIVGRRCGGVGSLGGARWRRPVLAAATYTDAEQGSWRLRDRRQAWRRTSTRWGQLLTLVMLSALFPNIAMLRPIKFKLGVWLISVLYCDCSQKKQTMTQYRLNSTAWRCSEEWASMRIKASAKTASV